MIQLSWILSVVIGIFLLWQVLSQFFGRRVAVLAASLILLGTNLFWLIFFSGPSAHVFLFTLYVVMIRLTFLWQKAWKWIPLVAMFPVMIIISFLNPSGLFIILFPVFKSIQVPPLPFWGGAGGGVSDGSVWKAGGWIRNPGQMVFLASLIIICIILRQFSWFTGPGADAYFGHSMMDFDPVMPANIHRVLFSARNGWLIYTPLAIPAVAGFYFLAEKNSNLFYPAFVFFLCSIVYAASMPKWWYDESFGFPNLIETYAVLSIPLGYTIHWMLQRKRITVILLSGMAGVMVLLNIFQTWQFENSIIQPARMTRDYYFATFGRTRIAASDTLLMEPSGQRLSYAIPENIAVHCSRIESFDFEQNGMEWSSHTSDRFIHTGNHSLWMNPQYRFSPGLIVPVRHLTDRDTAWVRANAYFYYTCRPADNIVFLVITCLHDGRPYNYRATELMAERFRPGRWNEVTMSYLIPQPTDADDSLHVFFWNFGGQDCYIDDFVIDLCEPILNP